MDNYGKTYINTTGELMTLLDDSIILKQKAQEVLEKTPSIENRYPAAFKLINELIPFLEEVKNNELKK
jgi:hypothetical protein